MPELNLSKLRRDLRLPELRLPEMSRDDIAKALGDTRKELREVRQDLQQFRREFEMPRIDEAAADVAKMVDVNKIADGAKSMAENAKSGVMQAVEAAGLAKPATRRSRRPFLVAGIVSLGVVGFALLNSPGVKQRLRDGAQRARERMDARRASWDVEEEPHAFDAAKPAGVQPSAYGDSLHTTDSPFAEPPTDLPDGLGENGTQPIEEDATARA
jgi:hypothetical protein